MRFPRSRNSRSSARFPRDSGSEARSSDGVAAAIDARCADLESTPRGFTPERDRYDLVCDFYFLDRSLLPELRDAVHHSGHLVADVERYLRERKGTTTS